MQYSVICLDKPDSLHIRAQTRGAHLEHLRKVREQLALAGPFLDEEGKMCGSLLVFDGIERDVLDEWLKTDPYAEAGLFSSVEVRPFKRVI